MLVPCAEWAPDMPDLSGATDICVNAVPRSPESYGPFPALVDYSAPLDGPCVGAIATKDVSDTVRLFAGTVDALYTLAAGATSWSNVSASPYALGSEMWRFCQWKNTVLATSIEAPIQQYVLDAANPFATLSADAPLARYIAVVAGFLMVANTYDPTGGYGPFRAWWSAINDPTSWPAPGSAQAQAAQSDYNDIAGEMGAITGVVGGLVGCDGLLFFERGIYRIVYAGAPAVFDFQPAEGVRGCRAPNSIVQLGGLVFYLGEDGFYLFDGNNSMPIGANKVDRWFYAQLDQTYLNNVVGAVDIANKAILWAYTSIDGGGQNDSILVYNWQLQRWGFARVGAEWLIHYFSFGTSMDSMAAAGFPDLDTVPYSLDSRIWVGGAALLGAFNATNHKLGTFEGTLACQMGTAAAQLVQGGKAFVSGVRPLVDGGLPTVAVSARDTLQQAETFGADSALNAIGDCPQRVTGRYLRARVTVPANATWTHFRGVEVTARPAGIR